MTELPKATAEPIAQRDLSGQQLGDYRLLRRLGRGAMAEVYLAEQASLRRQVALKVLKGELATDETYIKRFYMEARAAASLVHANIVQIHEVGNVDGVHYIAQEYVQGQNLRDVVARRGPLEARVAAAIVRQVASALHKASAQGIVHRDIKPENILLSKTGEVKVADFGLARLVSEQSQNLTQVGMTMGTPLYMSPEQVQGRSLDTRSDIYSLGVTAYHMLSGHPPFRGDTALSVALQHLNAQPNQLETVRPDLPPGLCRIVHKMLGKQPDTRYATPRDLLKDLKRLQLEGDGQSADEIDEWNTDEMPVVSGSRLDATQRLAALMRSEEVSKPDRRWPYVLFGLILAGGLLGGTLAHATRPTFLLADTDPENLGVPRKKSPASQFFYATLEESEEAWRAVIQYFPDDRQYVPRAQQELALLYFLRNDDEQAQKLFATLANMDEVERRYRAFGLAGQAVVFYLDKDYSHSADKLADLATLAGGLEPAKLSSVLDERMMRLVALVLEKDKQAADTKTRDQWVKWMEANPLPEVDATQLVEPVDNSEPLR